MVFVCLLGSCLIGILFYKNEVLDMKGVPTYNKDNTKDTKEERANETIINACNGYCNGSFGCGMQ